MDLGFLKDIEIRNTDILGQTDWYWVKGDSGAFGNSTDGPMRDWIEGHSIKYFQHVKEFDTIVTAGTCCGMYARFYAKKFKHVFAFEPDAKSFHCMVNNTPYDNVIKINAAIGKYNGLTAFTRLDSSNIGMNMVNPNGNIPILMTTIDTLNLKACSIIQLDTEGYERDCIEGAINTIKKFKPVIVAERFNDIAFMRSIGYEYADTSFMDNIFIPGDFGNTRPGYFVYG